MTEILERPVAPPVPGPAPGTGSVELLALSVELLDEQVFELLDRRTAVEEQLAAARREAGLARRSTAYENSVIRGYGARFGRAGVRIALILLAMSDGP